MSSVTIIRLFESATVRSNVIIFEVIVAVFNIVEADAVNVYLIPTDGVNNPLSKIIARKSYDNDLIVVVIPVSDATSIPLHINLNAAALPTILFVTVKFAFTDATPPI